MKSGSNRQHWHLNLGVYETGANPLHCTSQHGATTTELRLIRAGNAVSRCAARSETRYIKRAYNSAVEAADLDDVTFHTLRHTFASWAVMRGVTLKELQELLGHSSLTMTMRYAHLAPEHLRMAVSRLEGLTGSAPANVSAQASAQEPLDTVGASPKSLS